MGNRSANTVRKYLELEKIRYDKRLTYDINVAVAVLNQETPLIMGFVKKNGSLTILADL